MSFYGDLQRHVNSKQEKTSGMLNSDEKNSIKVEVPSAPRLDMNHGFIKSIVRNQIDRDEYDKLVSERSVTSSYRHLERPRKTCDPLLLYIPPHLRSIKVKTTKNEENSSIKDEKEAIRKEIRRRLLEQMAREEHERLQVTSETLIPTSAVGKRNTEIRRRSDSISVGTPVRNEPLFKLNIRVQDGNPVEQIVHANDNSARIAKALTRQLELNDDQCRLLRNRIEEELEKRLTA
uniref:Bm5041 n=1 Tax=Setaria digitata TaxID=48799 RepID=A0A915Q882_9BILA